eukprot:2645105-Rhodomonas_salina.1
MRETPAAPALRRHAGDKMRPGGGALSEDKDYVRWLHLWRAPRGRSFYVADGLMNRSKQRLYFW